MAQPDHYVQTDCSAIDHPKTHALAEALKCHEVAALGAITALRARVMRHCPDGDVSAVTERTLKAWLLGFPRATWAAFVAAGLVDEKDGKRTMHGWERYEDKEDRRALNAERMREARALRRAAHVQGTCSARAAHVPTTCAKSARAEGEGEVVDDVSEKGDVVVVGKGSVLSPFSRIYKGKFSRTNVLRRSAELRTTLGEGLAPFADRVAEVIATRAATATNPESYTTSAVRQSWCREIAAKLEASDAEAAEAASRAERETPNEPRKGGAAAVSLKDLLALIPGGGR